MPASSHSPIHAQSSTPGQRRQGPMRTLVLGGYGNFGARICQGLARNPDITLVIAGRDGHQAQRLAQSLGPGCESLALDHSTGDLAQTLTAHGIELLIHTAGPFQQQDYALAHAAARAGAHYVDLADGRRFVCDFGSALNATFASAGLTAITGASTVPALSSAVIDRLCQSWQRIDTIDICIAPAQTAPRGKATLEGVLSYCGEPVSIWKDARWQNTPGWAQPEPVQFARLKPRWGAVCDIPDLELFPAHYRITERMMFRAALEVRLTQQVLSWLAWLRQRRLIPKPACLAGTLARGAPLFDQFGSSLGGMFVRASGLSANRKPVSRAWHLETDHDHGPQIPSMPAILLATKLARGHALPTGAMPAVGLLDLDDFQAHFDKWGMVTEMVDETLSEKAS